MTEAAPPDDVVRETDALRKRGEHAAAAAALWAHGFPGRAGGIYEQIFEHKKAQNAYEAAGDVVSAARMALEALDQPALDRLVTLAIANGRGDELMTHLRRANRPAEEARVYLARGELLAAADAFERAGLLDRAAMALEDAGKVRDAGLILERHLEGHPEDTESGLRLGRILARFGRHDDAVRTLQHAVRNSAPDVRDAVLVRAAPTLLMSFVQLGYEHAARDVIARWSAAWERARALPAAKERAQLEVPPTSLEEFLQSDRVAALAAIQATPRKRPAAPPPSSVDADVLFGDTSSAGVAVDIDPAPHTERAATIDDTLLLGGRYLLGEPLGGGAVGQVFRAFDAFSDRPVAVKIFSAQVLASEAVRAFAREARAFAELGHPALAALVELNVAQGFAVSELIEAASLEDRLIGGGPAGWLTPMARALLDVLAASHRTGLVHGSLKPTNVFVLEAGVRVVDVGAHHLLALRSTETGGLASVWPYLSPEQLFGAPASAAGDLYALGAVLFRALTGRSAFSRAEDDRRRPPPQASSVRGDVPAAWDAFLTRALAVDPAARFADAEEMAREMPPLPVDFLLPAATAMAGGAHAQLFAEQSARYAKGGLVERPSPTVRVFEGTDLTLDRAVWLVEADAFATLKSFAVCARLWRGVQPVYDVLPEGNRVVLARDTASRGAAPTELLTALREVPQGLARDLSGIAAALEWLHGQGWAFGGFAPERAVGSVGLRFSLAPAPLLVELTSERRAADWESFQALIDASFDLSPDATLDGRGRLLAMLHDRRLLDRADLDVLGAEAQSLVGWPAFLDAVVQRLVQGASARVVARLVANVLRG